MIDRYSKLQLVGIYAAIVVFLLFLLLPFFEMFMASLRPLEHLFRSPYQFWSDDFSFQAYRDMWVTVPLLGVDTSETVMVSPSMSLSLLSTSMVPFAGRVLMASSPATGPTTPWWTAPTFSAVPA